MLNSQINQSHSIQNLLPLQKPFIGGDATNHSSFAAYSPVILTTTKKYSKATGTRTTSAGSIKAISFSDLFSKTTAVKGVITVQPTVSSALAGIGVGGIVDGISDIFGRSFLIELVSIDLDSYAWVKCEREEEEDCGTVLEAANIMGRAGSVFSAKDRYVRLSLIKSQDDFELLVQRLTELVSLENSSIQTS